VTGTLLLVPNTLDLGAEAVDIRELIPDGVLRRAAALAHWVAEDARTTRAFLKRVAAVHPLAQPLQATEIRELPRPRKGTPHDSVPAGAWRELLQPALRGNDIGLVSEAGLPAVADPGAALVAAAHALGVPVQPLAGASALVLALAASGLNGQSFAFVGYLPQEQGARLARLRELEVVSRRLGQTQLMIETPYRNAALLHAMLGGLGDATRLAVSCGLTLANGFTRSGTVAEWRQWNVQMPDRAPAVFALLTP
jgi:16S rRNA (cytidine1402-2'-O)-methyltransferase